MVTKAPSSSQNSIHFQLSFALTDGATWWMEHHLVVSYNNTYTIVYNLPMRCSACFMFANAVVDNNIVQGVLESVFIAYCAD